MLQFAAYLRPHRLELLWAAVSQRNSSIDFDYAAYAADYMARFETMWPQVCGELQH